jgi:hypothetical protein
MYKIIERCVDEGVAYGWNRAHKHVDNPTPEQIKEQIAYYVMNEISEWFDFSNGDFMNE